MKGGKVRGGGQEDEGKQNVSRILGHKMMGDKVPSNVPRFREPTSEEGW